MTFMGGQSMDQHQRDWNEKVAAKIIKNLEKRRMAGSYAADAAQAKAEIVGRLLRVPKM